MPSPISTTATSMPSTDVPLIRPATLIRRDASYRTVCIQSGADLRVCSRRVFAQRPRRLGLVYMELNLLATGGSGGTRADQGVCTISVQFPALGKLSDIAHECVRHSYSTALRLRRAIVGRSDKYLAAIGQDHFPSGRHQRSVP